MRIALVRLGLVGVLAALPTVSSAAIVTYSDATAFFADTGATDATGPLPFVPSSLAARTVGSVTFTAGNFLMGFDGGSSPFDWSTLIAGNEIAISVGSGDIVSNDGIDATFASGVMSAGFEFHEPGFSAAVQNGCNGICADSTFTVTLFDGSTQVDSFTFNAANDTLAFVGVWSDRLFDRMTIRETVGSTNAGGDNEFYGRFFTGVVPLPEPGAAGLLFAAAGSLGVATARGRRASRD